MPTPLTRATPSPALKPGTRIGPCYVVESLLGRGATCEVYRSYDTGQRRAVALKVLRESSGPADPIARVRLRLLREARLMANLQHPNIVPFLDVGTHGSGLYLALELCEGGNLRARIRDGAIGRGQKLAWLRQVGEALAYAHDQGAVHRDVKPENIVLSADGRARLTDFGIAKSSLWATSEAITGIVGTPRYMAPEQLDRGSIDGRTDQYAWALVAAELLLGRFIPLTSGRDGASLEQLGLPSSLAAVLGRCLRRDPQHRYGSMREILEALRRAERALAASHEGAPEEEDAASPVSPEESPWRARLARFVGASSVGDWPARTWRAWF